MDQTYKNAACVAVWLGLTPSISNSPSQNTIISPLRIPREDSLWGDELISELVNRPYWSRVWVIQEFLLGSDVDIWYGKNNINIELFQDMILDHAGVNLHVIQHMDYTPSKIPHRAWSLATGRTPERHPDFSRPLWRLLVDHRYSMCKDPRDKVFALLGLVPEEERDLLGRFFPNYDMSEDHVVIITLIHLQEYSRVEDECPEIMSTSDDIFLGLGVNDRSRRRELLRRTADVPFDYYDDLTGNPLDSSD
ncbi:uncharacterized protein F4807DRAFT_463086 [Annulohypoxylon truncatum]|uniref:uncharacterized protein n=1 Tax=Annulohypoxylon truncatum TaxID=327061 RepID=UPI0020076DDB|nr:uncharacterized protein F4807DRAFT_463086 [Annulohypoxylon truncatum]KAI1207022.1 hypothetical protein F4807DRAFT_463086 [Annulohypoxylon truncatum]